MTRRVWSPVWAGNYPNTVRPALQIVGVREGVTSAAGMYMVITKHDVKFLVDTTIGNIDPDAETIAGTAILAADTVQDLGIVLYAWRCCRFPNFLGDAPHPSSSKMARATQLVKERRP